MICNVERVARSDGESHTCGLEPARKFTAHCGCGHKIEGAACQACLLCIEPGCLTCWNGGKGHICPVEFGPAECMCGCGTKLKPSARTDKRIGSVRGRPPRYMTGHNKRSAEMAS